MPDTFASRGKESGLPSSFRRFGWFVLALSALFAKPLYDLVRFSLKSDTFSHVILVPFVALYLARLKRTQLTQQPSSCKPSGWFVLPLLVGIVTLSAWWFLSPSLIPQDRISLSTFAFVCFVFAAGLFYLGDLTVRGLLFPFSFLMFFVPLPLAATNALEVFFQYASADAASFMIGLSGLPAVRDGLVFRLPGLTIQVGQECSGIRSTLVLFITSLLAGYLFLRGSWKRTMLAFFVVPLAILRNGFRIWCLGWLSVEVNANIIHSPLHHHGGPLFFLLSLVPFFLLLVVLRKLDRRELSAV